MVTRKLRKNSHYQTVCLGKAGSSIIIQCATSVTLSRRSKKHNNSNDLSPSFKSYHNRSRKFLRFHIFFKWFQIFFFIHFHLFTSTRTLTGSLTCWKNTAIIPFNTGWSKAGTDKNGITFDARCKV